MFLFSTYLNLLKYLKLVAELMYLCLNKLATKVWKNSNFLNLKYGKILIVLIFIYTVCKTRRKSESSFSHSFLAIFPSLVMQQISSFFKQV